MVISVFLSFGIYSYLYIRFCRNECSVRCFSLLFEIESVYQLKRAFGTSSHFRVKSLGERRKAETKLEKIKIEG